MRNLLRGALQGERVSQAVEGCDMEPIPAQQHLLGSRWTSKQMKVEAHADKLDGTL